MSSIDNGLRILALLTRERPVLRVSEVSRALDMQKSSVSRLLRTLGDSGLLRREPGGAGYVAGARGLTLAELYLARHRLFEQVAGAVEALAAEFRLIGYVGALEDGEVVILRRHHGGGSLRPSVKVGQRIPAFRTALGRTLLARRPEPEVLGMLAADAVLADNLTGVRAELAQCRRSGLVSSFSTLSPGVAATAAAVAEPGTGQMLGFAVSFPLGDTDAPLRRRIAERVHEEARRLGQRFGDHFWSERDARASPLPDVGPSLAARMLPVHREALPAL